MPDPILVMTLPLPLPEFVVNGQVVETRVFEGDFSVFDQAQVVCSTVLNTLDADFIAQLPDTIKLIANIGVGYDNIDLVAASAGALAGCLCSRKRNFQDRELLARFCGRGRPTSDGGGPPYGCSACWRAAEADADLGGSGGNSGRGS